ncbi:MAG: hypothetical protein Q7K43_04930, partial [Candidatus Woesearchaeota archaeon]|nr:hypothetical protein [Candidatus Woesearchaeota archaeon]
PALGGIFFRFASLGEGLSIFEMGLIAVAFCISLLLFSFGLVAVNMAIKTQRTLKQISFYDFEKVEQYTVKLFSVFFAVFLFSLVANLLLYDYGLHSTFGALISLLAALAVVFAPQVIVIDNQPAKHVVSMSLSVLSKKCTMFLMYVIVAVLLLAINSSIFIALGPAIGNFSITQFLAVAVNALFIVPFLEVLKAQIYLSKYTLL